MPMHEHFEELCALAVIGQLSEHEHHELFEHLAHCDHCRQASDEFAVILDQLPAAVSPSISGNADELLSESYRQKFLERAAAEGLSFTKEASNPARLLSFSSSFRQHRYLAAFAIAAICLYALATLLGGGVFKNQIQVTPKSESKRLALLPNQAGRPDGLRPSAATETMGDLERQLSLLKQRQAELLAERKLSQVESTRLHQQLEAVIARSETLTSQLEKSGAALSQANAELEKLRLAQADLLAALGSNHAKIQELSEKVVENETALTRERELNGVAKDVRELMAARNLHIIDVYDYDTRGKRDKSFGRVLYTEGKSLIFYAFDLGPNSGATKVAFQAWGQREGNRAEVKNLGVFHIEDHAQKRWVLRVNDPKLLGSIEELFVTVEPSPGRDKPSGRKLLYAYLGTGANHP